MALQQCDDPSSRHDNFPKYAMLYCYTNYIQFCNRILSPIRYLFNHNQYKSLKRFWKGQKILYERLCLLIDFKIPYLSQQTVPQRPIKSFHIVNQHYHLLYAKMSSILVTEKGFWQPRIPLEISNSIETVSLPTKSWINFGNLRRICFPRKHKMPIKTRSSSC